MEAPLLPFSLIASSVFLIDSLNEKGKERKQTYSVFERLVIASKLLNYDMSYDLSYLKEKIVPITNTH